MQKVSGSDPRVVRSSVPQRVIETVEALRTADPSAIGDLMSASHRSMRDDFEISTPELDLAVSISMECGATGARMTGGGFGGAAIALAPVSVIPQRRTVVDEEFSSHDYTRPEMFVVRPSQGARRDE
jgi:galactokinase